MSQRKMSSLPSEKSPFRFGHGLGRTTPSVRLIQFSSILNGTLRSQNRNLEVSFPLSAFCLRTGFVSEQKLTNEKIVDRLKVDQTIDQNWDQNWNK